ncbi:MAG: acyltransferase family protein [Bacteroidota bacterium]|jgi:glucan biosynthesis protein C
MIHSAPAGRSPQNMQEEMVGMHAIRAYMLYLGILIHASVTYGVIDYTPAWTLKDHATHPFFDWLVSLIHCFRMPLFFVVSAYLGSMFNQAKGQKAMVMNLFVTIVSPFAFGLFLVLPLDALAFHYSNAVLHHESLSDFSAVDILRHYDFFSSKIAHLWYLYFLLLCYVLVWIFELSFKNKKHITGLLAHVSVYIFRSFGLRLLVLAGTLFLCLCWMGKPFIMTNNRWSIHPAILSCYFLFFLTGRWLQKTHSLMYLKQYPMAQLFAAMFLFLSDKLIPWPDEAWVLLARQGFSALYTTLFIWGFMALFLTCTHSLSLRGATLMAASNWVYILHLPVVVLIPGVMSDLDLPVFVKFVVTVFSTFGICYLSHRYLIKNTFMEKFFGSHSDDIILEKERKGALK